MKYTYNLYSEDMQLVFESDDKFNSIDELKKHVEKDGDENYIIYGVDDDYNYIEIETVRNII